MVRTVATVPSPALLGHQPGLEVAVAARGREDELQRAGDAGRERPTEPVLPQPDEGGRHAQLAVGLAQERLGGQTGVPLHRPIHVEVAEAPVEAGDNVEEVVRQRPQRRFTPDGRGCAAGARGWRWSRRKGVSIGEPSGSPGPGRKGARDLGAVEEVEVSVTRAPRVDKGLSVDCGWP